MTSTVLLTILATGFTISFFHASIPTHWLPFVLASRAQKWNRKKTLLVTLLAGSGHILMTTFLGVLIVWVGLQIDATVGKYFVYFAASILWLMGFYYILRHLKGKSHSHIQLPFISKSVNRLFRRQNHHDHDHDHHHHNDPDHAHEHFHEYSHVHAEGTTILGLFILLTCSPCEGFLPVYVSGISFGWAGFLLLTLILGIATLLGMILFTSLALKGIDKLNIEFLEKYESLIMGVLLFLLGFVVIFVE